MELDIDDGPQLKTPMEEHCSKKKKFIYKSKKTEIIVKVIAIVIVRTYVTVQRLQRGEEVLKFRPSEVSNSF